MNISALPELLLSWVKNQGSALFQGEKAASSFQAGQQYEGKVLDSLANGRHLVRVNSQLLDMNLPARTQAGDQVRLTFVNAGVRPTFLLDQAPVGAVQQVRISTTAQQVNALLRLAQTPAYPANSASAEPTPASVKQTATMPAAGMSSSAAGSSPMAAVRTTAGPGAGAPAASLTSATANPAGAAATSTAPSTSASALNSTQMAAASTLSSTSAATSASLLNRVAGSQASAGVAAQSAAAASMGRPIVANVSMLQSFTAAVPSTTATLSGANTGLLGQAIDAPRASIAASTTLSANTVVELPGAARNMLPVRLAQTLSESGLFYESHLAKWSRGTMSIEAILREPQARLNATMQAPANIAELAGMPEEAARLAGRQLQILEGGPFLWQGIAWPGQTMQWSIREEAAGDGQAGGDEVASEWVTELNLVLPRLGEVHAQMGLNGDHLRVRLLAEDAHTRASLEAALPLLADGFAASGLQAVDMRVVATSEHSTGGGGDHA